jgi:hypothetical protein
MVPSKMGLGVAGGMLLVFLGCWNWGPYVDPDQQGRIECFLVFYRIVCVFYYKSKKGFEKGFSGIESHQGGDC